MEYNNSHRRMEFIEFKFKQHFQYLRVFFAYMRDRYNREKYPIELNADLGNAFQTAPHQRCAQLSTKWRGKIVGKRICRDAKFYICYRHYNGIVFVVGDGAVLLLSVFLLNKNNENGLLYEFSSGEFQIIRSFFSKTFDNEINIWVTTNWV